MNRLKESLKEAIGSEHVSNATENKHERWFAKILKSKGFSSKNLKGVGLTTDDIRSQLSSFESDVDFYLGQPLGSQNTPDFVVCYKNTLYYIELKSSAQEKITWNSGYPHDGFIYLFSSGACNAQTIFMGQDAWDANIKEELLGFAISQKERTTKFNLREIITESKSKQSFFTRNMFNDSEKYYSREGRVQFEQNVFDFISNTLGGGQCRC